MTGEAEVVGDPAFDLGKVVKITVNADEHATIRSTASTTSWGSRTATSRRKAKDGGYVTILRLARDAQKS